MNKKLILSLIFTFLFTGNTYADNSLIKMIDVYWKQIDEIKNNNVDAHVHLFIQEELKLATDKLNFFGRPCYREVLKDKIYYYSNANCAKFRLLLGNNKEEWILNLNKFLDIFFVQAEIAKKDEWLEKWDEKNLDKFILLNKEMVSNMAVAQQLIALVTE